MLEQALQVAKPTISVSMRITSVRRISDHAFEVVAVDPDIRHEIDIPHSPLHKITIETTENMPVDGTLTVELWGETLPRIAKPD